MKGLKVSLKGLKITNMSLPAGRSRRASSQVLDEDVSLSCPASLRCLGHLYGLWLPLQCFRSLWRKCSKESICPMCTSCTSVKNNVKSHNYLKNFHKNRAKYCKFSSVAKSPMLWFLPRYFRGDFSNTQISQQIWHQIISSQLVLGVDKSSEILIAVQLFQQHFVWKNSRTSLPVLVLPKYFAGDTKALPILQVETPSIPCFLSGYSEIWYEIYIMKLLNLPTELNKFEGIAKDDATEKDSHSKTRWLTAAS